MRLAIEQPAWVSCWSPMSLKRHGLRISAAGTLRLATPHLRHAGAAQRAGSQERPGGSGAERGAIAALAAQ